MPDFDKYTDKQVGYINLRVWVTGDNHPIAYHIKCSFYNNDFSQSNLIWDNEWLGLGSKDYISNHIKEVIDIFIQDLAILFFKVRGEL